MSSVRQASADFLFTMAILMGLPSSLCAVAGASGVVHGKSEGAIWGLIFGLGGLAWAASLIRKGIRRRRGQNATPASAIVGSSEPPPPTAPGSSPSDANATPAVTTPASQLPPAQPAAQGGLFKVVMSLVGLVVIGLALYNADELVSAWSNRSLPRIEIAGTGASFVTFANWSFDQNGRYLQAKMTFKGGAAISQFTFKALDANGVILENGTLSFPKLQPGDTGIAKTNSFFKVRPARVVVTVE